MFIEYVFVCRPVCVCVSNVYVHRYVHHQLSSVRKSRALPVSDTIIDTVCQVWDAEHPRKGGGHETAVDPLMAQAGSLCYWLPCGYFKLPFSPTRKRTYT